MYDNTINVRIQAILLASLSLLPPFSPRALAHSLQNFIQQYIPFLLGSLRTIQNKDKEYVGEQMV